MDFFSILLETQETVVYNATDSETFVSLSKCRSSGGLAQLGEHYVRNVGVGGSTPLPSTKLILPRHEPQYSHKITHHFYRQVEFCAVRSSAEYKLFPEQFPQ